MKRFGCDKCRLEIPPQEELYQVVITRITPDGSPRAFEICGECITAVEVAVGDKDLESNDR